MGFFATKDEALKTFQKLSRKIQMKKGFMVSTTRGSHAGKFGNELLEKICDENGIAHEFSAPRIPQQN